MKRKVIRTIFYTVIATIMVLATVGFIFQDKILNIAIQGFRKDIRSRIIIGDAKFSLIKNFPYASISLYDVAILSTKDINGVQFAKYIQPDTLLKSKRLTLKLNILDLINNDISIKQIYAKKADLKLLIDKNGKNNFQIIKKSNTNTEVKLNINNIVLEDTKLQIVDLSKQLAIINSIEHLRSNGNFNLKNFHTKTKAKLLVNQLAIGKINYVSNKIFDVDGNIKSTSYKKFEFNNFNIYFKNNRINIDGDFSTDKEFFLNLSLVGIDLTLKDMNELVPKINKTLEKINVEGKASISAKAEGYWTKKHNPFLYGKFEVRGGKSSILTDNSIASVNLLGEFSNGKGNVNKAFVRVTSYKINSNFGDFEGKFTLTNFNRPLVSLSSNFNLFLQKLNQAYRIDSTNTIDGALIGNITANGNVNFDSLSPLKLLRLVNNGSFKISELKLPFAGKQFEIKTGEISFNPSVANANLNFSSNILNGKTSVVVNNFYDGVMEAKPITASVNGNMSKIDFDQLLALSFSSSFSSNKKHKNRDINIINLNLDVKALNAVVKNIPVANLTAQIDKEGTSIDIIKLQGSAFMGKIDLSGNINQNQNSSITTSLLFDVNNISIDNLFYSFNNFNQTTITNKNLKGTASGNIAFKGTFTNQGVLIPKSVECVADLNINNGELIKFEPAYKLSRFIDVAELEDIKFSNLKNRITISQGVVNIPAMYIGSSALNLGVIGTHSFNGEYSYRVRMALKDVLFKKAKNKLKKEVSQSEFENNTLLYFKIEGNNKTSKVSYDWNGKSWNLPDSPKTSPSTPSTPSILPQNNAPSSGNTSTSNKKFTVEWDGEEVSSGKAQHKTSPAPKVSTQKAKDTSAKKTDDSKFKVVWEDE